MAGDAPGEGGTAGGAGLEGMDAAGDAEAEADARAALQEAARRQAELRAALQEALAQAEADAREARLSAMADLTPLEGHLQALRLAAGRRAGHAATLGA